MSLSNSSKSACVICFVDEIENAASLKTCGHQFCVDCITRWGSVRQKPVCPLCFAQFDCILLPDGTERRIEKAEASQQEVQEADFSRLDHSFFLGDIQRLLQRTQHLLLDVSLPRSVQQQLAEISRSLSRQQSSVEGLGEFHAGALLQEMSTYDQILTTVQNRRRVSVVDVAPRVYGADDAHLVSSDDETELWEQSYPEDEASYRKTRNEGNKVAMRPSKPFENKPTRLRKHPSRGKTR